MSNDYFQFKQFTIFQGAAAMKVTTDSCLFGAWVASEIFNSRQGVERKETEKLLDIGAGTGLLSLMIAQKNDLEIDGVEIEPASAAQAKANIAASPFSKKINVIETDIISYPEEGYNYIISNPPFYENEWQSPVKERNVAHHSHRLKWSSLIPLIARKLTASGTAFLLLPSSRMQFANDLIEKEALHINKEVLVLHREGRSPFRRMLKISRQSPEVLTNELLIHDEEGQYSELFRFYLQDYYLYL